MDGNVTTPQFSSRISLCSIKPKTQYALFPLHVYLGIPASVIGIILNVLSVVVLNHMSAQSFNSALFLLKYLSVADSVFLVTDLNYRGLRYLITMIQLGYDVFRMSAAMQPLMLISTVTAKGIALQNRNWTIVLMSLDRLVHVAFPFKALKWFTRRRCLVVVIGLTLLSICSQMYRYFFLGLKWTKRTCPYRKPGYRVIFGRVNVSFGRYYGSTLSSLAPLTFLAAFTVATLILTMQIRRRQKKVAASTSDKNSTQAMKMTLCIIGLHALFELPGGINNILISLKRFKKIKYPVEGITDPVVDLLNRIDSVSNFIIFVLASPSFRKSLKNILFKCRSTYSQR
ncbi:somatostatin receptor type 2-like [Tubulanus polymorphus]|uniref:somatostatin receptor type 2-like n=1 Tax=Tubulanus polymorphus TaxID=672921 RepID=UPI003DA45432